MKKDFMFVTFFPVTFFPTQICDFFSVTFFPVTFFPTFDATNCVPSRLKQHHMTCDKIINWATIYRKAMNLAASLHSYKTIILLKIWNGLGNELVAVRCCLKLI